jgi:hypothetical protein
VAGGVLEIRSVYVTDFRKLGDVAGLGDPRLPELFVDLEAV